MLVEMQSKQQKLQHKLTNQLLSPPTLEPSHNSPLQILLFLPFSPPPFFIVHHQSETLSPPPPPLPLPPSPPHPRHIAIHLTSLPPPPPTPVVNNSNELGPVEELALPPNETSVTLSNLKYSTRYKFYLSAKTAGGAGVAITQEVVTIVDEGKSADAEMKRQTCS